MDVFSCDAEAAGLAELERLAVQEAAVFAAQARQLHASGLLSERAQGPTGPDRFLVLDVAGTLRIGQLAASRRLADADRLVTCLPRTLVALETGALLLGQARLLLEQTSSCTPEVAGEVERRLLADPAGADLAGWTARRLRERLARLVLQIESERDPQATVDRLHTARTGRRVSVRPEADGMGSLWALLPAEQLRAFTLGLDELTRRQRLDDQRTGVQRTADQRRADLLVMLPALALHSLDGTRPASGGGSGLPADPGAVGHPAVVLSVHVPMATALGLSCAPGTLEGYGPISAAHVHLLLPDATLRQVLVDQHTGQPLHVDDTLHPPEHLDRPARRRQRRQPADPVERPGSDPGAAAHSADPRSSSPRSADPPSAGGADTTRARLLRLLPSEPIVLLEHAEPQHDPSAALTRLVQVRDPICTGPGCATASTRSDLDHEIPWPLGPTHSSNLRPRSRRCHRAKTFSWQVTRTSDGHLWTSPTGRTYRVPPSWGPPPLPDRCTRRPQPRRTDAGTASASPRPPNDLINELEDLACEPSALSPRATLPETEPPF